MTTTEILALARKHLGNGAAMDSSARLCMAEAVEAADAGLLETARARALRSLAYSVGIFSPDYQKVACALFHRLDR